AGAGDQAVRDGKSTRSVWLERYGLVGDLADDGVLNCQRCSCVEYDSVEPNSRSVDDQAAQIDDIAHSGIDGDTDATRGHSDDGVADVADDADRLGDVQRSIVSGIENDDDAVDVGVVVRDLQSPARLF